MATIQTTGGSSQASREARRRRIVERGSDRLALITGRIQTLPAARPEDQTPAADSSQQEDIVSGPSLPNQESGMEPTQHNTIGEPVEPLQPNSEKGRSIVSRAAALIDAEEDISRVSSSMQNTLFALQPEQPTKRNLITTRQIHSAISTSENIRTCCSIGAAILVILSYTGFPIMSWGIFTSVVFLRPLYLLLLTNITIVIGRLILGAQGAAQMASSIPSFGGNGLLDQMGNALELGLLLQKISSAFFMDFSIYAVVLICGFSLVRTLGW